MDRNLIGVDLASLFLATKESDKVTIPNFFKSASPYFKVAIPRKKELEITKRYPWLKRGDHDSGSPSLEISFTDSGIPLSVVPSHRKVTKGHYHVRSHHPLKARILYEGTLKRDRSQGQPHT